ncbi:hydroxypyruvate isomerase [Comamonas serinivorans]|uniref:Hydroxypyruvate isomerase n=1 Tax=Comamonas serinivorans TaxID=1082851 RepID=A0A1Y0EIA6_9BURK|nr:TIM barrel protein [Comamonas serinivorans]ARU03324.1 hydroxypyruvate isomerase [Comamonas serinivorans]
MPKFAANLSTLYPELPFLDRIAAAAADGFDAVECQLPYDWPAEVLAERLAAAGLPLVLFNAPPAGTDAASIARAWADGARGLAALATPSSGREAEFQAGIALALHYAQVLRCPRIHVMSGLLPSDQPNTPHDTWVHNLRWAADRAAPLGIDLLIEPINGKRDMPGYALQHQASAHALIEAVNRPNLRLQLDLYHCQIMDGDLAHHLQHAAARNHLGHVQIAGVPSRHEPDVGEVNFAHLLQLLDALGPEVRWSGYVGAEYRPARGAVPQGTHDGLGWLRAARSAPSAPLAAR